MPTERLYADNSENFADGRPRHIAIQWGRDLNSVNVGTISDNPDGPEDGIYMMLTDRRQANRLIRILRRARDQAFGRDE